MRIEKPGASSSGSPGVDISSLTAEGPVSFLQIDVGEYAYRDPFATTLITKMAIPADSGIGEAFCSILFVDLYMWPIVIIVYYTRD